MALRCGVLVGAVIAAATLAACGGGESTVVVVTQPTPAPANPRTIQAWLPQSYTERHLETDGNQAQKYSANCVATEPRVVICDLRVFDYASGEPFPPLITVSVTVSCTRERSLEGDCAWVESN